MEQNHMEILLEEMRGQFSLVLEGHAALHAKIDDVRRELVERMDLTDFKVEVMSGEIKELKEDVAVLKSDVATLKVDVADLKKDVAILKVDVSDLKGNLAAHRADTEAHPRYLVRE